MLSRTIVVISGNCTVGMGDEAWGIPPRHKNLKKMFSSLALGDRERWIWGVQKRAELWGFIESFWDGLGAEFSPFLHLFMASKFQGTLRFFIFVRFLVDLYYSVITLRFKSLRFFQVVLPLIA